MYYPAIVERALSGGYGVFFPDLPGCVSAGANEQEAAEGAEEALALHLAGLIEDGDPLPKPTRLDQVVVEPDIAVAARLLERFPKGVNRKGFTRSWKWLVLSRHHAWRGCMG
ncbi:MAG: hypothetical protein EXQ87_13075, partial [Alphaproteobacteria bacterium]|nr:hypothetical protein [Alphaproteobacteria bacterium]